MNVWNIFQSIIEASSTELFIYHFYCPDCQQITIFELIKKFSTISVAMSKYPILLTNRKKYNHGKKKRHKMLQSGTFEIYWLDEYCIKGQKNYAGDTRKQKVNLLNLHGIAHKQR